MYIYIYREREMYMYMYYYTSILKFCYRLSQAARNPF